MAFAYVGNNNTTVTSATEIDGNVPAGVAVGNLIVAVFAFENVGVGSAPYITPNIGQLANTYIGPHTNWEQICQQAPSGTGFGLEVWASIYQSGSFQFAKFNGTYSCTTVTAAYSGAYAPNNTILDGAVRDSDTAQVTGNAPPAPSVFADSGDLIIAIGSDGMTVALFGTPAGTTNRVDVARAGAGTAEGTIADKVASTTGATGLITFPNNANSVGTLGTTATLAIRPAASPTPGGALLAAPMPEGLDIESGYGLRVAVLSPATGESVPGANVGQVVITATPIGEGDVAQLQTGDWMLVPGPGA